LTVPGPEPGVPDVIVIQETALEADQVHPVAEVTLTEPVPAPEPTGAAVGVTACVHVMPACEMSNVRPAIVMLADRDDVEVLAATL
jgi:hypothetical protein